MTSHAKTYLDESDRVRKEYTCFRQNNTTNCEVHMVMNDKLEYKITPPDLNQAYKSGKFMGLSQLVIGDTLLYDSGQNTAFLSQELLDHLNELYDFDIYLKGESQDWYAIRIISHK